MKCYFLDENNIAYYYDENQQLTKCSIVDLTKHENFLITEGSFEISLYRITPKGTRENTVIYYSNQENLEKEQFYYQTYYYSLLSDNYLAQIPYDKYNSLKQNLGFNAIVTLSILGFANSFTITSTNEVTIFILLNQLSYCIAVFNRNELVSVLSSTFQSHLQRTEEIRNILTNIASEIYDRDKDEYKKAQIICGLLDASLEQDTKNIIEYITDNQVKTFYLNRQNTIERIITGLETLQIRGNLLTRVTDELAEYNKIKEERERQIKKDKEKRKNAIVVTYILAFILCLSIIYLTNYLYSTLLNLTISNLQNEFNQLSHYLEIKKSYEERRKKYESSIDKLLSLYNLQSEVYQNLNKLENSSRDIEVKYSNLVVENKKVEGLVSSNSLDTIYILNARLGENFLVKSNIVDERIEVGGELIKIPKHGDKQRIYVKFTAESK
ncbi:MAG: hypothetical protein N2505_00500 [Endomicrobia bacterium]|nr:hypothetical protein [Endomicrobiia bacterium]